METDGNGWKRIRKKFDQVLIDDPKTPCFSNIKTMNPTTSQHNPTNAYTVPSVSITTARTGASSKANALGMRAMQERAYAKRGEQYLLIKSPPASGKSRALMFIALDKVNNQGLQQAIVVVPERSIGGSFARSESVV